MKPIIENQIVDVTATKSVCFVEIINAIANSADENTLRRAMNKIASSTPLNVYFDYGFGGHHMWLLDLDSVVKSRVLIVEF